MMTTENHKAVDKGHRGELITRETGPVLAMAGMTTPAYFGTNEYIYQLTELKHALAYNVPP